MIFVEVQAVILSESTEQLRLFLVALCIVLFRRKCPKWSNTSYEGYFRNYVYNGAFVIKISFCFFFKYGFLLQNLEAYYNGVREAFLMCSYLLYSTEIIFKIFTPYSLSMWSSSKTRQWLLDLYNYCLGHSQIPYIWRKSKVVAILKPGKQPNYPKCHLDEVSHIAVYYLKYWTILYVLLFSFYFFYSIYISLHSLSPILYVYCIT